MSADTSTSVSIATADTGRPRLADVGAIITGGSSGIGLAIAQGVLDEGARVTLVGRNTARLDAALERLQTVDGRVTVVAADLDRDEGIDKALAAHRAHADNLGLLINSAGVARAAKPARQSTAELDEILAIDLRAVLILYQRTIDDLLAAATRFGVARVINIASITGRYPQRWLAAYSAAKAAVISYTQSMNQSYASRGVLSSAVCPGFVDTPMSKEARDLIPEEMITAEDVAESVRMILRLSPRSYVPEVLIARSASSDPSGV